MEDKMKKIFSIMLVFALLWGSAGAYDINAPKTNVKGHLRIWNGKNFSVLDSDETDSLTVYLSNDTVHIRASVPVELGTAKWIMNLLTVDSVSVGSIILPVSNDGASIGIATQQFKNIFARHIDGDSVFIGVLGKNIDADQRMITDLGTLATDSVISNTGNLKLSGARTGYVEVTDSLSVAGLISTEKLIVGNNSYVEGSKSAVLAGRNNLAVGDNSFVAGEGCTAGAKLFDFMGGEYSYSVVDDNTVNIVGTDVTAYFEAGKPFYVFNDEIVPMSEIFNLVSVTYTNGNTRLVKSGGRGFDGDYLGTIHLIVGNVSQGNCGSAEGGFCHSVGSFSHAEGFNTVASGNGSHAEGLNTIASGYQSHAEGFTTIASGNKSHAEGYNSKALRDYQHSRASGHFSEIGDAQMGSLVMRRQTTSDTPTQLFIDGSSQKFTLEDAKCYTMRIMVVAKNVTDSYSASWIIEGRIDNIGATPVWEEIRNVFSETTGSTFEATNVAVSVVTGSPDELKIGVTGKASRTIRWVGYLDWVEVK
jgi:hypothetical protein